MSAVRSVTDAALVAAGLLSVVLFPATDWRCFAQRRNSRKVSLERPDESVMHCRLDQRPRCPPSLDQEGACVSGNLGQCVADPTAAAATQSTREDRQRQRLHSRRDGPRRPACMLSLPTWTEPDDSPPRNHPLGKTHKQLSRVADLRRPRLGTPPASPGAIGRRADVQSRGARSSPASCWRSCSVSRRLALRPEGDRHGYNSIDSTNGTSARRA